jgi:hypothetical protein
VIRRLHRLTSVLFAPGCSPPARPPVVPRAWRAACTIGFWEQSASALCPFVGISGISEEFKSTYSKFLYMDGELREIRTRRREPSGSLAARRMEEMKGRVKEVGSADVHLGPAYISPLD